MRIEDLKRWHWMVIGLGVGLLVAYWRGSIGVEAALANRNSLDISEFLDRLGQNTRDGRPRMRDIRVYPLEDGVFWIRADVMEGGRGRGRGRWRDRGRQNEAAQYQPRKIRVTTPFVPRSNPPNKPVDPNYTIVDYLTEMKAANPGIDFSTRWWDNEPVRSMIWAAGGIAVIGGIWPSIINLLIGAGYGRRAAKEPEYDLSRFGKGPAEPAHAARTGPSEEELARLRALEAELEKNLGSAAAGIDAPAPAVSTSATPTDQPIRKLTGGPVETAQENKPKDEKHYAGEFYPTVTHVKH